MVLEEGMEWKQVGISPEHAQMLETQKFSILEVARWGRVQPHLLQDLSHATFSNIEHLSLEFLKFTMLPWFRRFEQQVGADLLGRDRELTHFAEFLITALERADLTTRMQSYVHGIQNGIYSPNDVRAFENQNPYEGGDNRYIGLNMLRVGDEPDRGDPDPDGGDGMRSREFRARQQRSAEGRRRLAHSFEPVFAKTIRRLVRAEKREVLKGARKLLGQRNALQLSPFLEDFYRGHFDRVSDEIRPIVEGLGRESWFAAREETGAEASEDTLADFLAALVSGFALRHVASAKGQLVALVDEKRDLDADDLLGELELRFDDWETSRPERSARRESVQVAAAAARESFRAQGFRKLRWVSFGENCPFCTKLNGRIVGIDDSFASKGEEFDADGAETPLKLRSTIRHPPIHRGCDCQVVAVPA